ncbi:hypothetical protein BD310DRAFT_821883 [Dichomitus squalens]|uniref:Uncharacterized protein n=1 Tax=Dichomitus squalens TaxID=114155 RepID=A0A4Q9PS80_9APHY|nr:hypothetical protein BD310DRAFT_821883 [Dichomitus squalens]
MVLTVTHRAPIASLPVELLSYIFLLGAHTPDPEHHEEGYSTDELTRGGISPCMSSSSTSPEVFASVNKHWRVVALGTPHLWTRIVVTIGDTMNDRGGPIFANASRYLARSAKCLLDIFIDARDPDWDFSEVDPYNDELYDYQHPFRVEHMHHVLNILLPHVRRFRSLAILTDRWAPMQTALDCISMELPQLISAPRPLPLSLPSLESLVLMRCNEFVPYLAEFSPADRKDPNYLPFSALLRANERAQTDEPVLPRLKKLILSGVHTNWAELPRLLPAQLTARAPGLETLELSYHCNEVRPTERDFKALLERCPRLKELTVRVSGPRSPGDMSTSCSSSYVEEPLPLPCLESIELGYDDAYAAATILDTLNAPALRHLALEESSSPALEERLDAEPLLTACTVPTAQASVAAGKPPFPALESLALTKVDASAEAFAALYKALPSLRELTVSQMFLLGGEALRPDVTVAFKPPILPPGRVVEVIEAAGEHIADRLEVRQPCEGARTAQHGPGGSGASHALY